MGVVDRVADLHPDAARMKPVNNGAEAGDRTAKPVKLADDQAVALTRGCERFPETRAVRPPSGVAEVVVDPLFVNAERYQF